MGKPISLLPLSLFTIFVYAKAEVFESKDIRRAPRLLQAIGPLAFGVTDGDDAKIDVPKMGKFGMGDVTKTLVQFTPEGAENQDANGGTFEKGMRPGLGYMDRETTAGKAKESSTRMKLAGLGTFDFGEGKEQGTGLIDFSNALFPFLKLPELKTDDAEDFSNTNVDPRLGEIYYPKPRSYLTEDEGRNAYQTDRQNNVGSSAEADRTSIEVQTDRSEGNPFDSIRLRGKPRVHGVKTENVKEEGFIAQKGKEEDKLSSIPEPQQLLSTQPLNQKLLRGQIIQNAVPIGKLGLPEKEIFKLCAKFAPIAAQHCYVHKVDPKFLDRCRGYNQDCAEYIKKARPLGAIANSFSSGVGMTFYDWQANEQGGIGNGHNGKIDFGSWGGGYSDNLGVRDYWSQTTESGGNWYDGVYGYKSGWSVPIVQSLGIEGHQGSQARHSRMLSSAVGPYVGLSDRVGVDWLNGGVSFNKGFSVPLVGIGVSSGTGIGFPSVGMMMKRMGLDPVETVNAVAQSLTAASR
ncbi:hypothetical protein WR25_16487 [Diploscapter pachys]|uniref:Bacterial toxin 44 domain-containing protein n=1 Tax=Diploscapter pachys TaxID=2018661 RepID=A0A2A2J9F7_9BILA|nr:hypothetical protein WR25_16487 [Diploscapter pachys]